MVRQPEHEGSTSGSIPDPVRRKVGLDIAGRDEDHLPPQGQEQDQTQEAMEPVHVHVLLSR
jgi:hypothetical protein